VRGGPPLLLTRMSTPEGRDGAVDEALEIGRVRHVAADREPADPLGLALEKLAAAREHADVHALLGEGLGDGEPDALGRAADDCRPAAEA
jgi:hypothetical protein